MQRVTTQQATKQVGQVYGWIQNDFVVAVIENGLANAKEPTTKSVHQMLNRLETNGFNDGKPLSERARKFALSTLDAMFDGCGEADEALFKFGYDANGKKMPRAKWVAEYKARKAA